MIRPPCAFAATLSAGGLRMTDTRAFAELEIREWAKPDVAQSYASAFAQAADMVVPNLVTAVRAGAGHKALDLCCGHGNVAAGLARAGAKVTGLDFSPAMLEMARRAVPDATFLEGDAMDLPFGSDTFDAVTIGFGMPHVPEPPKVLAEARRVMRPGGRIAFSVWCGPEVGGAMAYVFGSIAAHGDPEIALPAGPGANDYADRDYAFAALATAGFTECQMTQVASGWQVSDPGAPFDFFRDGTARGGALLRPQPAERAAAIRADVVAQVRRHHGDGPDWTVPIPAVVMSAVAA